MKFTTSSQIKTHPVPLLGLFVYDGKPATVLGRDIDKQLGGLLSQILQKEELKGKVGEYRLLDIHDASNILPKNILLIGVGDANKVDAEILRKAAARVIRTGNRLHVKSVALEGLSKVAGIPQGQAIAEGALLGNYRFEFYKSKPGKKKTVEEFVVITSDGKKITKGIERGVPMAEATNMARDFINIPANDMTPRRMADEAQKVGKLPGLSVKILNKAEIEKLGMGCYLAVSIGSTEPPYFIHLHYRPTNGKPKKKVAIIGKGVTFDSGGLSLKPAQSMETMKDDMSGAAAIVGVMKALSVLKPNIEVHGFAAMTENMPSGSAVKPGDIAKAMNGKTVEILNTDAEGRLTLADALGYAQKQKPDMVIDVATLTGACVVALGELCCAILGNNQKLINQLIDAGKSVGEKIWQLPLIDEYREELKSPIADLKNIGGRWGGTINGALFLEEFVEEKMPWAHIDIAGPSWTEKEQDYCSRGGTGFIVRTLLQFLLQL